MVSFDMADVVVFWAFEGWEEGVSFEKSAFVDMGVKIFACQVFTGWNPISILPLIKDVL